MKTKTRARDFIGRTVTMNAGASNPRPVVWTVKQVRRGYVVLAAPGHFDQRVSPEAVALAISKQS